FWDVRKTLPQLRERGITIGVVSNLWPFPADHIFEEHGLGEFFPTDTRIYSFEVGYRKPDPEIFLAAARRFGVHPSECLMVGDNLKADCVGAVEVGMQAALIDRPLEINPEDMPKGVVHLQYLTDLLPRLTRKSA
ncbi:MAG: HAD-IA family hydrolase, partial [Candidatus Obscuribacterales bacterium]|nr:HAD-IA family hydrolase [Candidatus Obscuribacterales bacterium]